MASSRSELCGEFAQMSFCCGPWGPKGFIFGETRLYCKETGVNLKERKLIIAMEGRNDCLLCPCGLLLASRLGFVEVKRLLEL